jgi:hypothetical protein
VDPFGTLTLAPLTFTVMSGGVDERNFKSLCLLLGLISDVNMVYFLIKCRRDERCSAFHSADAMVHQC